MNTALSALNIPLVVTPLNMSSQELDELSSITYLSYFIKQGSPGYATTLNWVKTQLLDETIENFSVYIYWAIYFMKVLNSFYIFWQTNLDWLERWLAPVQVGTQNGRSNTRLPELRPHQKRAQLSARSGRLQAAAHRAVHNRQGALRLGRGAHRRHGHACSIQIRQADQIGQREGQGLPERSAWRGNTWQASKHTTYKTFETFYKMIQFHFKLDWVLHWIFGHGSQEY